MHALPIARSVWEAWRWANPVGKWGESALSLKVAETMQGASRWSPDSVMANTAVRLLSRGGGCSSPFSLSDLSCGVVV